MEEPEADTEVADEKEKPKKDQKASKTRYSIFP